MNADAVKTTSLKSDEGGKGGANLVTPAQSSAASGVRDGGGRLFNMQYGLGMYTPPKT